ncbi:phosphoribosylformylglycinamidine cyclo-ligase [Companilactobacillus sp. RD055328]|uniref:phosphoribosylformylglycinamidine cyclo-ligase n=1 Tax=Companilactobacillus sp. RD055328 TaxID=2916634 RepID=UPI001FC82B27|nr:phosphoribosylformylglycinamidine cyclo-ligase [Companilactobacillus sp. RD055328]GKQ42595.1 phosphoribosylformylglycinamidine cyclo-ligase [Companilactobacillus sp. RD055328]
MANEYEKSGVNIQAGYQVRDEIKEQLQEQLQEQQGSNIGNFGGVFDLNTEQLKEPTLVSGTDGVGTKLLVAEMADKYDTIGIDCVAMCVNDIIAQGAKPLYFMDYIASGVTNPARIKDIIQGIIKGCQQANIKLIGGETAEMPGTYENGHFDIAGFSVGIAEKSNLFNHQNVEAGDVVIGIKSSGVHSNGFSLIRKIFFEDNDFQNDNELLQELLEPTRIYVDDLLPILNRKELKAIAHITGGGFYENIPRVLPDSLAVKININSWDRPEIFGKISQLGNIEESEMFNVFNMGIGMVLIVSNDNSLEILNEIPDSYIIGEVTSKNNESVELVEE